MPRDLLDIVLAEYTTLRDEILMKLRMFYQMYVIYFSALALFYGYVVNNKQYDFIMVVPLVSLALFYRLFYDQKMIKLIGNYIENELIPNQLVPLMRACKSEESHRQHTIMKWNQFYADNKPFPYYKLSIFLVFVIFSIVPPLLYSVINLSCGRLQISQLTTLPLVFQWLCATLSFFIGFWITWRIFREDF